MRRDAALAAGFRLACVAAVLVFAPFDQNATEPDAADDDHPTAGGRLVWVLGGELDLLGDTWVDLPFAIGTRDSVFASVETRTTIEQSKNDVDRCGPVLLGEKLGMVDTCLNRNLPDAHDRRPMAKLLELV